MDKKRVFIVDDESGFTRLLKLTLEKTGKYQVLEENDGTNAWLPPVLGPLVGGVLGAVAYDIFIGRALVKAHRIATEQRPEGMDASYKEAA